MKHLAIILIGFAAVPAIAAPDTDYPHRPWGTVLTLDMSVSDETACIARTMGRHAEAAVIPMEAGNDIDVAPNSLWGPKLEPWMTFKVREEGGAVTMRAFYRHPVKKSSVSKDVARLEKRCLQVKARSDDATS